MNRRSVLKWMGIGAAAATWPAWLREAFAGELPNECGADPALGLSRGVKAVAEAYRRAHRAGKPLLIIVIPAHDGEKFERGRRWGELLNHGTHDQLAPLALAEVACATMTDLRKIIPTAIDREPTFLIADTAAVPAKTRAATVIFDRVPDRWSIALENITYEDLARLENEHVDRNIARLAEAVREALLHEGALEEQAARARVSLGDAELRALEAAPLEQKIELVDRGAAILMLAAERADAAQAAKLHGALAAAVNTRLLVVPPLGSRWATSGGCGIDVEGEDSELVIGCGMGHSPAKSRRFLYLFAQTPAERFRESMDRRESDMIEE